MGPDFVCVVCREWGIMRFGFGCVKFGCCIEKVHRYK